MAKKYPDKIKEEIKLELLNDNCSLKDIAEKFNVSYGFVKKIRKINDIKRAYNPNAHPKQETLNKLSQKAKEYQKKKRIEKFNKEYTIEQINKTIELLKEGESLKDILNETKLTIKDILLIKNKKIYEDKTKNINFPQSKPYKNKNTLNLDEETIENIKNDLIKNELSINDIAKKYNIKYCKVKKIQNLNNIVRKPVYNKHISIETKQKISQKLQQNHKISNYSEEQIKKVIELLLEYKTIKEINEITKISCVVIRNIKNKQSWTYLTENIEFPQGYKKICNYCNKEFIAKDPKTFYCSKECKKKQFIKNHTRTINCKYCGKQFTTHYDNVNFCSTSCASKYNAPIVGFGSKIRPQEVWNKGLKNCFNEETLKKMSNGISKSIIEGRKKQNYRGRGGYRKDLDNQYFRSTWEANVARIFKLHNIKYEFEKHRFFIKKLNKYYIPDFYLPEFNLYIEVKGYWFDDASDKFKFFQEEYKDIEIRLIDKAKYIDLKEKYEDIIQEWER